MSLSLTGNGKNGENTEQAETTSKWMLLKATAFFAFVIAAVCLFNTTPIKNLITLNTLNVFLEALGFWAPLGFILIFSAGICLFVPTSILTFIGAAVFGAYQGFLYSWMGAMAGSSTAFFISRTLGRDLVAHLIGDRMKKYDDTIERNGFATVFYLRLLNTPFTYVNFGIGLTKVHFRDYFFGTGSGVLPSIFVLSFFAGTLKKVWVSGDWGNLMSSKVFFSVALFVFSFFIPMIVKKFKGQTGINNVSISPAQNKPEQKMKT